MPVNDTWGAQTCRDRRKQWFQPLQTRSKVPGRNVLAGRTAGQVLARRSSVDVVPSVLSQTSSALENTLATCAYVPGIPAQLLAWAVAALSSRTSRGGACCLAQTGMADWKFFWALMVRPVFIALK